MKLSSILPQIPSFSCMYSIELLYSESKGFFSSFQPLFRMNLNNFTEITENFRFFSLKKLTLAKFVETTEKWLENSIIGFGEFEEIISFDQICFYGGKSIKKKILHKTINCSEVLKLSWIFFSNYFKKLKLIPPQLKIYIGKSSTKQKTYTNLCFINQKLFFDEINESELYLTLLMETFLHFFTSNEIEMCGEKLWLVYGVGLYAVYHFIEKGFKIYN
jgi:hypothetical protein